MHEISLVRGIFNTLEAEFTHEELGRLEQIHVKVGLLSNVEPILMQNAFDAVTLAEEKFQDVQLEVELVPISVQCEDCDHESVIKDYKFVCDSCKKPTNNIITGTELLIHQVRFSET